ncbi:MAG: class I SAM-dependent methyltransferase [Promethearchaeota archaeon]
MSSSESVEQKSIWILKIPLNFGNQVMILIRNEDIIDKTHKITVKGDFLFIPLIEIHDIELENLKKQLKQLQVEFIDPRFLDWNLERRNEKQKKNLKEELIKKLPLEIHDIIPRGFDIFGDLAVIELNREDLQPLQPFATIIGQTILDIHPHLKGVFQKGSVVEGVFRTRKLNWIVGKKGTETIFKENNCVFRVDIEKTFFTPRLGFERKRVTTMDTPFNYKGMIWDMFCGVGPFFIQIAKNFPETRIIATDINPTAINLSQKNIILNKISTQSSLSNQSPISTPHPISSQSFKSSQSSLLNRIHCFTQNVQDMPMVIENGTISLKHNISRIIMNLPEKNLDFLPMLPLFLHEEGALLHIYQFSEKPNPLQNAKNKLTNKLKESSLVLVKILNTRIVKPFSPALETTVIDAIIKMK